MFIIRRFFFSFTLLMDIFTDEGMNVYIYKYSSLRVVFYSRSRLTTRSYFSTFAFLFQLKNHYSKNYTKQNRKEQNQKRNKKENFYFQWKRTCPLDL